MWKIEGDEFEYKNTIEFTGSIQAIYNIISAVEGYSDFLTDVAVAKMEADNICHMIYRVGPLRVLVRSKFILEENKGVHFEMIEGPMIECMRGSWHIEPTKDGALVTFETYIKAGRAGKYLLKTASRYLKRKNDILIEAFRQQIIKNQEQSDREE